MDHIDLHEKDICRACLKELRNSKFGLIEIEDLKKMFFACTSMEIVEDDVYTKFLCKTCYNMIEKFYKFRTMCTESYNKLQNMVKAYNEENTETTSNKSYEKMDEDITKSIKGELINFKNNQELKDDLNISSSLSKDHIKEELADKNDGFDDNSNLSESESSSRQDKQKNPTKKSRKMLTCELCSKKFFKESRRLAHMRIHKGLKPYPCNGCDKEFNKKHLLAVHYEVAHSNLNKLYHCPQAGCTKAYKTKRVLDSHHRTVHVLKVSPSQAPCICETCGKVFVNKAVLREHSYTHSGELPFKCDKCPKRFTSRHKLKLHCMRHDGIKKFVCPHCGLRKITQKELNVHLNYHTRERILKCPHCTLSFLNSGNLNRHIRIVHQGVKAYSCTHCSRSFAQPGTLEHHIMTHTGEKPHECKSCKKRFIQMSALKMHLKRNAKCKINEDIKS